MLPLFTSPQLYFKTRIIDEKKQKKHHAFLNVLGGIFLLVAVFVFGGKGVSGGSFAFAFLPKLVLLAVLVLIAVILIILANYNVYYDGCLHFTTDAIEIERRHRYVSFQVHLLQDALLEYNSLSKNHDNRISFHDIDNRITFTFEDQKHCYQFRILTAAERDRLLKILSRWPELANGAKVKIVPSP